MSIPLDFTSTNMKITKLANGVKIFANMKKRKSSATVHFTINSSLEYFIAVKSECTDSDAWEITPGQEFTKKKLHLTHSNEWDEDTFRCSRENGIVLSSLIISYIGKLRKNSDPPFIIINGIRIDTKSIITLDPMHDTVHEEYTIKNKNTVVCKVNAKEIEEPISSIGIKYPITDISSNKAGHIIEYNSLILSLETICDYIHTELSHDRDICFSLVKSKIASGHRVTIINSDGTVLGDSDFDKRVLDNHLNRCEVIGTFFGGISTCYRISDTLHHNARYVCKSTPIKNTNQRLLIRLSAKSIHNEIFKDSLILNVPTIYRSLMRSLTEFREYFMSVSISKSSHLEISDKLILMSKFLSIRLSLLDSYGSIIFDTIFDPKTFKHECHSHRFEILRSYAMGVGYCIRYSRTQKNMKMYTALKIYDKRGLCYIVRACKDPDGHVIDDKIQPYKCVDIYNFPVEYRPHVEFSFEHTADLESLFNAIFSHNNMDASTYMTKINSYGLFSIESIYDANALEIMSSKDSMLSLENILDAMINGFSFNEKHVFIRHFACECPYIYKIYRRVI